jgi:hypothetical protein
VNIALPDITTTILEWLNVILAKEDTTKKTKDKSNAFHVIEVISAIKPAKSLAILVHLGNIKTSRVKQTVHSVS